MEILIYGFWASSEKWCCNFSFCWFLKNKHTKFDPNRSNGSWEFERYMKMGHISSLYIYIYRMDMLTTNLCFNKALMILFQVPAARWLYELGWPRITITNWATSYTTFSEYDECMWFVFRYVAGITFIEYYNISQW